jgi:hypothetical protein
VEAHPIIMPTTTDALSWEPAPKTICDFLKLPEDPVLDGLLKSVKAEIKTLVDAHTFILDGMRDDEFSTLVMKIFKVKIKSDRALDKPKPILWFAAIFRAEQSQRTSGCKQLHFDL